MRGFKAFAFAATASVLLAGSLQAQQTGLVKWMGVNGAHSRYSTSSTGAGAVDVYRSPYFAQFNMGSGFGPTQDIFCVDFFHHSNTGTYSAFFTNLGTDAASLGTTTRSSSLTNYRASAWLATEMVKTTATENQKRVMQAAIWQLMSGVPIYWQTVAGNYSGATSVPVWIGNALAGSAQINLNEWVVVTAGSRNPNGGVTLDNTQEYITHVTPEPATLLLLGTGLLATLMAAGALRRSAV